jgi:hypothetical protein
MKPNDKEIFYKYFERMSKIEGDPCKTIALYIKKDIELTRSRIINIIFGGGLIKKLAQEIIDKYLNI